MKEVVNVNMLDEGASAFQEQVSILLRNKRSSTTIEITVQMDTGSPVSFIQAKYVPPIFFEASSENDHDFIGLNGSRMCTLGSMTVSISFRNSLTFRSRMLIVRDGTMHSAAILGRNFMEACNLQLLPIPRVMPRAQPTTTATETACIELMSIEVPDNRSFEINPKLERSHLHLIQGLIDGSAATHESLPTAAELEFKIRLSKDSQIVQGEADRPRHAGEAAERERHPSEPFAVQLGYRFDEEKMRCHANVRGLPRIEQNHVMTRL